MKLFLAERRSDLDKERTRRRIAIQITSFEVVGCLLENRVDSEVSAAFQGNIEMIQTLADDVENEISKENLLVIPLVATSILPNFPSLAQSEFSAFLN